MQCRSVLTRIDAMRTGELPEAEAEQVHTHLKRCSSCEESTTDLAQLARSIKSLVIEPPRPMRETITDHFDVIENGKEKVLAAFSDRGLRMIHLGGTKEEFRQAYARRFGRELEPAPLPARLRRQLIAALSGQGVDKPSVDLSDLGEFEKKVLETLTRIPAGEVRSYKWVARQAGRPKAVRAVGTICAHNVVPFVVPCHRVVPATGGIGQYAFGSPVKKALLRREGVPVDELEKLAQRGIRYVGSKTTGIYCFPTCRDARRVREENRVAFRDEQDAAKKGFRPCKHCQPAAA
jgi:O-6-methylguanine DNA methyltransferase